MLIKRSNYLPLSTDEDPSLRIEISAKVTLRVISSVPFFSAYNKRATCDKSGKTFPTLSVIAQIKSVGMCLVFIL